MQDLRASKEPSREDEVFERGKDRSSVRSGETIPTFLFFTVPSHS